MHSNLFVLATAAAALLLPFASAGDTYVRAPSRHRSRARILNKRDNSIPAGWKLAATCVTDAAQPNRLLSQSTNFATTLTPAVCVADCNSKGFAYAGVQYGQECWCGDKLTPNSLAGRKTNATECNMPCTGDKSQNCGGFYRVRQLDFLMLSWPWQPNDC